MKTVFFITPVESNETYFYICDTCISIFKVFLALYMSMASYVTGFNEFSVELRHKIYVYPIHSWHYISY